MNQTGGNGRQAAREDEEGAVEFVMQKYLKGGFVYN